MSSLSNYGPVTALTISNSSSYFCNDTYVESITLESLHWELGGSCNQWSLTSSQDVL